MDGTTLKEKLNRWPVHTFEQLAQDLSTFQFWYNAIRTHNNLNGKTPDEVWYDVDVYVKPTRHVYYFNAWNDLLTGFYHPP